MNTPVGEFFFYEGSLVPLHGVVQIVENLPNGRLRLQRVSTQRGIKDVGRTSIREASPTEIKFALDLRSIRASMGSLQSNLADAEVEGFAARQAGRAELLRMIDAL